MEIESIFIISAICLLLEIITILLIRTVGRSNYKKKKKMFHILAICMRIVGIVLLILLLWQERFILHGVEGLYEFVTTPKVISIVLAMPLICLLASIAFILSKTIRALLK